MDQRLSLKYEENEELDRMVKFILEYLPDSFPDVFRTRFAVMFCKKESPHHLAGQCRVVPDAMRFKTGLDYVILIWKKNFQELTNPERLKILIHELHHILLDDSGNPRVRRHNEQESFCELPSHDVYSSRQFELLKDRFSRGEKPLLVNGGKVSPEA